MSNTRNENITRKLAIFVGVGHVANCFIDCEEFWELLAELDPVPSRTIIDKEMTLSSREKCLLRSKIPVRCRHMDQERYDQSFPRYYSTLFHSNGSQGKSCDTSCEKVSVPSYC